MTQEQRAAPGGEPVAVGRKAPAFSLKDQDGRTHRLRDYAGRWLVVYFYPRDQTSGCTKEACQFRDSLPDFSGLGAAVLGVSPDSIDSHARFRQKENLPFDLLADPEAKVLSKYGVWQEKSMYGRTYPGVVRTTYLIDPEGRVAERWDRVKVPGHAEAVLSRLGELLQARAAEDGPAG